MPLLVSACLAGELCRYDGKYQGLARVEKMVEDGLAIPVCPEMLGGLGVPRQPCEILEGRVVNREGRDVTKEFTAGAQAALDLAKEHGCKAALLKARSPSCGCGVVYDGSFSHVRVSGDGVFAGILRGEGITLYTEENDWSHWDSGEAE